MAGPEEIFAQKLMVYSCQLFRDQTANMNPALPGLSVDGVPWDGGAPLTFLGDAGPFTMAPMDYLALEEGYVIPSLDLKPIYLKESWLWDWYTDVGSFSQAETGGTDIGGFAGQAVTQWKPPERGNPQDVHFWVVVRDGRGGMAWLTRTAHYTPP
jgi:hypothetical protein